jgi:hypothetical protein
MGDTKRIDRILSKIRAIWVLYPNMRLGQIMKTVGQINVVGDIFYLDDELLEKRLDDFIKDNNILV